MENALVRLIGWKAAIFHADPSVYDRYRWLKRYLKPGPLRTLDAGCGNGVFSMYAAKIGNETLALSNNEEKNRKAKFRARILNLDNIKFLWGDLRELDKITISLGKFDQIICFETIEHILNDKKLIADLSNLLKPEGRLLFTAPHKYHRGFPGFSLTGEENGGHVRWGYTILEIKRIFNECGLDVQAEDYISGFVSHKLINLMLLLHRIFGKLISWAISFPLRGLWILDLPLTKLIGYPHLSIAVVGIKHK